MDKLSKAYKDLLKVFKIEVNEDGGLFIEGTKLPLMINKKPLVLPTRENVKNSVDVVDGEIVKVTEIFNPFDESAIKSENPALLKLKEVIERRVNFSFAIMAEVLFTVLANEKKFNIESMEFIELISEFNKYKTPNLKSLIDERTAKNFISIYKKISPGHVNGLFIHIYLKRGGKIEDKHFNRMAVISFPVYEKLNNLKKDGTFEGIKLRNKDIHAYQVLHEYIFKKSKDELLKGIQLGSEDINSPGTLALLQSYDFLSRKINKMIDLLLELDIDSEDLEEARLNPLPHRISTYAKMIKDLKGFLEALPKDNREALKVKENIDSRLHNESLVEKSALDIILSGGCETASPAPQQAQQAQPMPQQTPQQQTPQQESSGSALDIILGGTQQQNTQMPMMPQQQMPMMQMPMQQPMGNGWVGPQQQVIPPMVCQPMTQPTGWGGQQPVQQNFGQQPQQTGWGQQQYVPPTVNKVW